MGSRQTMMTSAHPRERRTPVAAIRSSGLRPRFGKQNADRSGRDVEPAMGSRAAICGQLRACSSFLKLAHRRLRWGASMDDLPPTQHMPADHYRRRAAQARRLAGDATTPAVRQHLRDLAARLERLAEGVDEVGSG
jgi:hypothetical protein